MECAMSQSDRELLELAAKAAGYTFDWLAGDDLMNVYDESDQHLMWNPLTDDGDALQLAVKLQLIICNEHIRAGAAYCTRGDEEFSYASSGNTEDEVIDEDYAATRRAIVMAAAEIGRAM